MKTVRKQSSKEKRKVQVKSYLGSPLENLKNRRWGTGAVKDDNGNKGRGKIVKECNCQAA